VAPPGFNRSNSQLDTVVSTCTTKSSFKSVACGAALQAHLVRVSLNLCTKPNISPRIPPKMTSPVSIRDAILLSQLAYKLGKSLTVGCKSAPETHKQAQNQLFALSHALLSISIEKSPEHAGINGDSADKDSSKLQHSGNSANLQAMLDNCEDVLERLRALIEKYTSVGQETDEKYPNRAAKWRGELKSNWKKVRWTLTEGDVEKLHKELTVHIQSLNLAVAGSTR